MDILEEARQFKKLWIQRSILGKLLLVLVFGGSIMSAGSLADSVFSFKGFIVDALKFYRSITEFVISLAKDYFLIDVSRSLLDALITLVLVISISWRTEDGQTATASGFFGSPKAALSSGYLFILPIVIFFAPIEAILIVLPFILYPFEALERTEQDSGSIGTQFMIVVISVYLLVGIVAAVSFGLSRPLS